MSQQKLKAKTVRLFEGQLEYLRNKYAKNTDQFIRVAVEVAIQKDKNNINP